MAEKEPPGSGPEGDATRPRDDFESASGQAGAPPADSGPAAGHPTEPKALGDFEILRELGRGGMGVVYEARQVSLNRRVALKVLPSGLGLTASATERFEREARATAKLHHTNIVPVHFIGSEEGCHYYAMELIEGPSLTQVLEDVQQEETRTLKEETLTRLFSPPAEDSRETTPSPSSTSKSDASAIGRGWCNTVARQLADVADALEHAHSRGVVHRDIKPANLLLSPEGRLCITDFGLARIAEEPGMTRTGAFMGTPSYMSPEQARGERADHRSDIYSLGVVLYEMLTLRRPFAGASAEELLQAILSREPTKVRRINPRCALDLETICLKALEKDPQRRYSTAGEFAQDLRQYLHGGLIAARRAGLVRRVVKSIRRHPTAATAVALAVLFVAIIAGVSWVLSGLRTTEAAQRAMADARLAMKEGEYRESLKRVDAALALHPNLTEARLLRVRLLIKADRRSEALREAETAIDQNPNDWTARLMLATLAKGGWDASRHLSTISSEAYAEYVDSELPETADAYYFRALITENPSEAVELLNRALELEPAHYDALLERTGRLEQIKEYPAALQDCERLALLRPRSSEARRTRAWLYRESGDRLGAVAEMDKAVEFDPQDPSNYDHRAQALAFLGKHQDAVDDLTRAIGLSPRSAQYYWRRSQILNAMGRFDEALADANTALETDPHYRLAYESKLRALLGLGDKQSVRETLRSISGASELLLDAEAASWTHQIVADYYYRLGDLREAFTEATRAIRFDLDDPVSIRLRIRISRSLEDSHQVEADCRELVRMAKDRTVAPDRRLLAGYYGSLCGQLHVADEVLTRLAQDYPQWPGAFTVRGVVRSTLGDLDGAVEDLTNAIELAPHSGINYENRSMMYRRKGLLELALADIDKAVELNPFYPGYHWIQAYMLFVNGRLDESLARCEKAMELDPTFQGVYRLRAMIHGVRGDCNAAIEDLRRAKSLIIEHDRTGTDQGRIARVQTSTLVFTCPDQYDRAVVLDYARRAVERDPTDQWYLTAYGAALYYDEQYELAKEPLFRAMEVMNTESSHQLFRLSMIGVHQGDRATAQSYFDRAVMWMEEREPRNPELILLRREAARLLGIEEGQAVN